MRGSKILTIFVFVSMMLSLFLFYQEEAEALEIDYIIITNVPDGAELITVPLPIGGTVTAYASGYNNTGPTYVGLLEVDWSGLGGSWAPITGTSSTYTAGFTSGLFTQTALNGTFSDTFDVDILPPTIDYILITDTPDGTPYNTIDPIALPVGGTLTAYASGYNITGGDIYIGLIEVDWSGSGGSWSPPLGTSSTFTAGGTPGLYLQTAQNATLAVSDTFDVDIISATLDYIKITDVPGGIELTTELLEVGGSLTAYASGYNNTGPTYVGLVDVDWVGTGGSWSNVTGTSSTFTAGPSPGIFTQTALNISLGVSDSFDVDIIIPATVDYIKLTDAPNGVELNTTFLPYGCSIMIYASGYNISSDYVNLVEVNWSESAGLGSFSNLTGTITVFTAGFTDGVTTITGDSLTLGLNDSFDVNVSQATVDYIVVTDSPNGATLSTVDLPAGESVAAHASGYNYTQSVYVDVVEVDWSGTGGTWSPLTGTNSTFTAGTTPGIYTQTAQNMTLGVSDTFDVNILPGVDYIVLTDAPDGNELTAVILPCNASIFIYASGYNNTGPTYVGLVDVTWSESAGLGSFSNLSGTITVFTVGSSTGFTNVTGENLTLGINDSFEVEILPGTIDFIRITNSPGGQVLATVELPLGGSKTAYASGYNNTGPTYVDLVEVDWSGPGGTWSPSLETSSTFTAGMVPGLYTQTAENLTMGMSDDFNVDIISVTVDYICITDIPDGVELTTVTLPVGGTVTAYASGYNNTGPTYVGLVEVDWSGSGGGWSPTVGTSSTFTAGSTPGLFTQTAQNATLGVSDSFDVNIIATTLDFIKLTNAPNGTELSTTDLAYGGTLTIYASGYNITTGYVDLVEVNWSESAGLGSFTILLGTTTNFTAGFISGVTTITGESYTLGLNDFFDVNISQGTIDYIVITDSPDGDPLNTVTLLPDSTVTAYASGYNYTGSLFVDLVEADWSGLGGAWSPLTGTNSTFTAGTTPGLYTQTAQNTTLGVSDTFDANILPGIDFIVLTDAPDGNELTTVILPYNASMVIYASGYNDTGPTYVSLVDVNWSESAGLGSLNKTSGFNVRFTAGSTTGFTNITGESFTLDINDSFEVEILPGTVDFIQITNSPNGQELTTVGLSVGGTVTAYASGYNDTGPTYVELVEVDWSGLGGTWLPTLGTSSTFTAGPTSGLYTQTAENMTMGVSDTFDVYIAPSIDYIVITDAPDGIPLTTVALPVGGSVTAYASGYNNTGPTYVGLLEVDWTQNPELGVLNITFGKYTMFTAEFPGLTTITGENTTLMVSDDFDVDITGVTVDYILITDSPDGVELTTITLMVGETLTAYASGYNNTGPIYVGLVEVDWSGMGGSWSPLVGTSSTFTAGSTPGLYTQIAQNSSMGVMDSFDVDIITTVIQFIIITDAPNGNELTTVSLQSGETVTAYASGFLNYSNPIYVGLVEVDWSGLGGTWSNVTGVSSTFTAGSSPGIFMQTAQNISMEVSDSFDVEIIVNETIDYISIMDSPGGTGNFVLDKTYSVWGTDTFYAAGFNYSSGFVMDVLASWNCSDLTIGNVTSPGVYTTFTAQWVTTDSICNVTITYEGLVNTTSDLTILTPRTDYIQIRSEDNGQGAVITSISFHKGDTDIFYGAVYNYTVVYIGSVPQSSTWNSTNSSIVQVSSPGNSSTIMCSIVNGGTVIVTLDDGLGQSNTTTVTVLNWTVDYILIMDSPLGGGLNLSDPSNYPSYPVGHETVFWGAMYNYTVGYIGDVASTSTWISSNSGIVAVTTPGVFSTITCSDNNFGVVTITLEEWMGHNATTQVTVLEPTIDFIKIMDAPLGIGNVIGNMAYILGYIDTYYAAAFNNTADYLYDVTVSWSSDDTDVGTVDPASGSSTNFTTIGIGTCVVTADYGGGIDNTTGTLTVSLPSNITVDDDGGAHFTSIQEAITYAKDGDTIYVYNGTYYEHIMIDKSITLMGENKDSTIIDGEGYGKIIFVLADNVSISGFTIQNGEYGIYCQETNSTLITHNIIQDYTYGIYCNLTIDGYIAHNEITDGEYGIVTYEAYNDAIRYNTISYNTEYGAKDYNSQLKNCFNWNYFHNNKIAYYYDPDTNLSTMEFDGNVFEDNYIAIKVENASTISITNNTAYDNDYGIYLINASPKIDNNTISKSDFGIYAKNSSSLISNNDISEIAEYGIYAKHGDSLKIINNSMRNAEMIFFDSIIKELWLIDTNITRVNTTVEDTHLDATSLLEVQWLLHVRIVDEDGEPIEGATILIYDVYEILVSAHITDSGGWIEWVPVTDTLQNSTSIISHNPYSIVVMKDSLTNTSVLSISDDIELVISLESESVKIKPTSTPFPWGLIILIGFIGAIGVGALCTEVMKYGLLTLFLPLYSRIKREKLLDQPTRERIYGYIIGNPGAYFGLIKEELDLGSGQAVYHLKQLEEAHLIYSKEDGIKKRFYPADIPKQKSAIPHFSDIQEKILGIIKDHEGIGQKKIASHMGISRQVAGYHLTKMERKGLIEKEVVGRESRYYPSEKYSV